MFDFTENELFAVIGIVLGVITTLMWCGIKACDWTEEYWPFDDWFDYDV